MPSYVKEYTQTYTSSTGVTNAMDMAFTLDQPGQPHLIEAYVTVRGTTVITSWARLSIGTQLFTGAAADNTDNYAMVLTEGFIRPGLPQGGMTGATLAQPMLEGSLVWSGDHALPRDGPYTLVHHLRCMFYTQMGSTQTFELHTRVRYDQ